MNQCCSLVRRGDKVSITIRSDSGFSQPTMKNAIELAWLRRVVVALIGFTVLLVGLAMVVLPGPAVVVIPLGLAILATEFLWARRLLEKARTTFARQRIPKKDRSRPARLTKSSHKLLSIGLASELHERR